MDNSNASYEPMDVDMSSHSIDAMDISFNKSDSDAKIILLPKNPKTSANADVPPAPADTVPDDNQQSLNNKIIPTNIKKFHIQMQTKKNETPAYKMKVLTALIIIILSFIAVQIINIQCSSYINPPELKKSLSEKLYGQSNAIDSLIDVLSASEKSKVLFLYGGTGVGKTFTASIIMEHVGHYSNVYHYTMPSFMDTFTTEFMIGLTICKHCIIIVDDLSAKDMDVKTHINEVILKSKNLDKVITIILIYNCDNVGNDFVEKCDESLPYKLLQNFNYIDAYMKVIKFEPLNMEHLRKCIKNELGDRKLSSIEFEKIVSNFNVTLDGCKGVYTKMKFMEF